MRKIAIALLVLGVFAASSAVAANAVRISQVYGGGGNSGAFYKNDYVELFNNSGSPVNIGGWTLMYASSASAAFGGATNMYVQMPVGATIPACRYYLIQLAAGTGGIALPVAANATGTIAASATAGKFGLATSGTSGTCSTTWVDLVSYGGATLCWEGTAPTTAPSNTNAVVRGGAGMTDTDQNLADFTSVLCNASLAIHNSASPANVACLAVPATRNSWGQVKTIYR